MKREPTPEEILYYAKAGKEWSDFMEKWNHNQKKLLNEKYGKYTSYYGRVIDVSKLYCCADCGKNHLLGE